MSNGRHRYEIILYWSADDGAYVWIETAKELGRPIPEPRGGRVMQA